MLLTTIMQLIKSLVTLAVLLSTSLIVDAQWIEVATQSNPESGNFGNSIAMSETLLVASAPDTGLVKIFSHEVNSADSKLVDILERVELPGESSDGFGKSVALSRVTEGDDVQNEVIIVGSPHSNAGGLKNAGLAWVFRYSAAVGGLVQIGRNIQGSFEDGLFGSIVAISDDGMVICVGTAVGKDKRGLVELFRFNGEDWDLMGNRLFGREQGEMFGASISIEQRKGLEQYYIAIGSPNYNKGEGVVQTYYWEPKLDYWRELIGKEHGDHEMEHFGQSISLGWNGSILYLAVGSSSPAGDGKDSQARVQTFRCNPSNIGDNWYQFGSDILPLHDSDGTGEVVEMRGNSEGLILAVGSPKYDTGSALNGAARVYKLNEVEDVFHQLGEDIIGENAERLGSSFSFSGKKWEFAVGAPSQNHVRVFRFTEHSSSSSNIYIIAGVSVCVLILVLMFLKAAVMCTKKDELEVEKGEAV